MPRPATGNVAERVRNGYTVFALRFRAYGERQYLTLGTNLEGWTRAKAEAQLRHTLADVERGIWQPERPEPVKAPAAEPTFHEFASQWLRDGEAEWRPNTIADYRWALELHLLPHFAGHRLSEITIEEVDRYRSAKLREGKLAPNAINKTLTRLAQVLEVAVEYGHIEHNPAKGKRRRAKPTEPKRSWVEPEQLLTLLDASSHSMRPLLATLAGAGLRIGEAIALTWADINLGTGTITVRESKTAAGEGREVDMPIGLREELTTWKARTPHPGRTKRVFLSGKPRDGANGPQTSRNAQARLKTAVRAANVELAKRGIEPISEKVTPHSLRRTYASIRAALRDDPVYIAEQLGHRDATFTFRMYQRAAKRRERLAGANLAAFDAALEWSVWAPTGTSAVSSTFDELVAGIGENAETRLGS